MATDDVSLPMALLAVISDIHGNVWALDAVLGDVARRGLHAVVNLGDSLAGPLAPAETADRGPFDRGRHPERPQQRRPRPALRARCALGDVRLHGAAPETAPAGLTADASSRR